MRLASRLCVACRSDACLWRLACLPDPTVPAWRWSVGAVPVGSTPLAGTCRHFAIYPCPRTQGYGPGADHLPRDRASAGRHPHSRIRRAGHRRGVRVPGSPPRDAGGGGGVRRGNAAGARGGGRRERRQPADEPRWRARRTQPGQRQQQPRHRLRCGGEGGGVPRGDPGRPVSRPARAPAPGPLWLWAPLIDHGVPGG